MNRKKFFGIAVLVAAVAMCLMFTTCGPKPEVDDGVPREVVFQNYLSVAITINCVGTPSTFTLPVPSRGSYTQETVSRTGKSIVINAINPASNDPDLWDNIDIKGALVIPADKNKNRSGLAVDGGILEFRPAVTGSINPVGWNKITVISQDE
jgi:hypothetical protein